jgi:tetratricopeptide (TPR) repeat protein
LLAALAAISLAVITVDYPRNGSVFPPDFAAPTFEWRDESKAATRWRVEVRLPDKGAPIVAMAPGERMTVGEIDPKTIAPTNELPALTPKQRETRTWKPDETTWTTIKRRAAGKAATVVFTGLSGEQAVSSGEVRIEISKDPVGAPIFYRDVPLMSSETEPGVIKPLPPDATPLIAWRLRDVSKTESRKLVDGLPTCANCHSFSRDGKTMGMDLDGPQNDKGLYALTKVEPKTVIRNEDVVAWSSFRGKLGGKLRVGFMSQVSPDGNYVVSTINAADMKPAPVTKVAGAPQLLQGIQGNYYLANFKDYRFLQVFYPTRGILGWYSRETGKMQPLPGADDDAYVHTNVTWAPDGSYVVFARAAATDPYPEGGKVAQFANDPNETKVRYDLYRMPFNGGKGGVAEPIEGASSNGMSNSFAKVSPDGKWIVYVQARNGLLMRPDSQLHIVPAKGGKARRMNCNTELMNSWHSFSPNGRWLVFSSKSRSPYTQMFLTHIDENGNDSPAILIENSTAANRAVNIPEFVNIPPDGFQSLEVPAAEFYGRSDKARALAKQGKEQEAIEEWKKAIALNPEEDKAHNSLGLLLTQAGRFEEALTEFERTKTLNPEFRGIHSNTGVALTGLGRYEEAAREFETALQLEPDSTETHNHYGRLLLQQGRMDDAIAHFRKVLETTPDHPTAHNNMGFALASLGKMAEAEAELRKSIAVDPSNAEAHNFLGLVLVGKKEMAGAEAEFRKAIESDPNYPGVHYNLGRALMEAGRLPEAAAELEKAVAADPGNAEARTRLGYALMPQRRVDEAITHFEAAVKLDPNSAEAHFYLGSALCFMKGKPAEGLEHWRAVIALQPEFVPALSNAAWLMATHPDARVRNGGEAVKLAEQASRLTREQDASVLDALGAAYAESGRFPEAVEMAKRAESLARQQNNLRLAAAIGERVKLYGTKAAYRETN